MLLFNTLTNKKEEFVPITPGEVKMYACGPTVYNYFHIGNARVFVVFDTLRNFFEYRGYKVKFVQNFTDIDDKIINAANREGVPAKDYAERFIAEYYTDAKGLGVRPASVHPRATEHIDVIIDIVKTLVDKGFAYESNGDVYFSTKKFSGYGKLSHQPLEELEAGARIEVTDVKRDPMDFALWKAAKEGEPFFESPWGKGRPGWHIECSAMCRKHLGETIDIHAGGKDLIFPHHENEIAQSECANGADFAHYWLHNGYINVDNAKMSKSKGNFFTVRDIAEKFGYGPIRMFLLSAHYRSPINYSVDILEQAAASLKRINNCRSDLRFRIGSAPEGAEDAAAEAKWAERKTAFIAAMEDDLNTADALAAVFDLVRDLNTYLAGEPEKKTLEHGLSLLNELCGVLGIADEAEQGIDAEVEALIAQRTEAKKNRNYAEADRIRDELKAKGIILEDTPQGVKWKRL